jgi:hypothetical protein
MNILGLVGLRIQGYEGYAGYEGLGTLIRAGFQGPVHIVRQTISNLETQIRRISAYHRYEGLSIAPQYARESRRIRHIPGRITNPMSGICGYVGNNGLKVCYE